MPTGGQTAREVRPSMIPAIDPATLSPQAQKIVSPSAPEKLQEVAARGVVPGIQPVDIVAILVLLSQSERANVAATAQKTIGALPDAILGAALSASDRLAPASLDALARAYIERVDVLERLVGASGIDLETIEHLAKSGGELVCELVATNEERLLSHPKLIELLYMNKRTRMSTADRIVELAARNKVNVDGIPAWKEAATAIENEMIAEASAEPTPDDLLFASTQVMAEQIALSSDGDVVEETPEGEEVVKQAAKPLHAMIAEMTISQKIRTATLGNKEARMLLIRDNNKLVASAAIRSPQMQEADVESIAKNRNVIEEVLRIIGTTSEWLKNYQIKLSLVENPKSPAMIAMKLIPHLRESDLKNITKSKNIPGHVKDAAKRHLEKKKK
jgi:nucleotide-binding universal stress UspA family protein